MDEKLDDSEVRAFIYQQIADIEGLLPVGSQIDLQLSEPDDEGFTFASIHIVTDDGEAELSSKGSDDFDAIKSVVAAAKEEITDEFPLVEGESIAETRESLVNAIIDKNYLH